jgi:hypothetical protein
MREISRSVQIVKQAKKKCVTDCTVRTDADVAGPYDTWQMLSWQGRTTCGRCWLAVVWMNFLDTWHVCGEWIGDTWPKQGPPRVTWTMV